jgi:hypothetical protein
VWTSETFYLNTALKLGVEQFYTLFSASFDPLNLYGYNWAFGFGAGTLQLLKNNTYYEIEGHVQQVNMGRSTRHANFINQLRVNYVHGFSRHLAVFAGPSLNMLVSERRADAQRTAPSWAFSLKRDETVSGWVGFNAGLRF